MLECFHSWIALKRFPTWYLNMRICKTSDIENKNVNYLFIYRVATRSCYRDDVQCVHAVLLLLLLSLSTAFDFLLHNLFLSLRFSPFGFGRSSYVPHTADVYAMHHNIFVSRRISGHICNGDQNDTSKCFVFVGTATQKWNKLYKTTHNKILKTLKVDSIDGWNDGFCPATALFWLIFSRKRVSWFLRHLTLDHDPTVCCFW